MLELGAVAAAGARAVTVGASILLFGESNAVPDLREVLSTAGFQVRQVRGTHEVVQAVILGDPQCIIVCWSPEPATIALLSTLRHDALHAHLPVLLVVPADQSILVPWEEVEADDFWLSTASRQELVARVRMNITRSMRHMDANPLTKFPGNTTIMRELQRCIGDNAPWGIAYLDVDFFKPFNDKYGFSRGDEVLRMTCRLLANAVLRKPQGFVGHVGGDDFTFIVRSSALDETCREVTRNFDEIVPSFYDDEDKKRGFILSQDRQGNPCQFPMMTCSIAAIDTGRTRLAHVGEISKRIAELKKVTKSKAGSIYLIDRRN